MRLDDYQKWLDSMFVDEPAPPAPALIEQQLQLETADEVVEVVHAPVSAPAIVAPATSEAMPHVHQVPRPDSTARPAPLEGEDEVPQIDDYLPFRRGRQSAEPEFAPDSPIPVAHSEPLQTTITVEVEEESAVADEQPVVAGTADEIAPIEILDEPVQGLPTAEVIPPVAESALRSEPARRIAAPGRLRQVRSTRRLEAGEAMKPGELWSLVPRHLKTLFAMQNDEVVQNSYKREFKESRVELISRLLDPTLSLEETARLLNVCPTTVRRYTNRGQLTHHRTQGDQRRFRLSDVLAFLDAGKQ